MQRKNTVEWVVKDGSIFTKDTIELKVGVGGGKIIHVHESIAFNVGQETAERIVRMHNESLDKKRLAKLWDRFMKHLNEVQPLGKHGETLTHKSFLGSVDSYRRVFVSLPEESSE